VNYGASDPRKDGQAIAEMPWSIAAELGSRRASPDGVTASCVLTNRGRHLG